MSIDDRRQRWAMTKGWDKLQTWFKQSTLSYFPYSALCTWIWSWTSVKPQQVVFQVKNLLVVYIEEWIIIKLFLWRVLFCGPVNCVNSEKTWDSLYFFFFIVKLLNKKKLRNKCLNDRENISEVHSRNYFPLNFSSNLSRRFFFLVNRN